MLGWLPDGTPHYAPVGQTLVDGDRLCCHLCGQWFLSVASHLRVHGWTKAAYLETFGLEYGNSLAGEATYKRRAAALMARQVNESAIRDAQTAARRRARSGRLTAAATAAATGRTHPLQRQAKTAAALACVDPEARTAGTRQAARERLVAVADAAARAHGFEEFGPYVLDRLAAGLSLAAISREAGQHKDWVGRHLAQLAPDTIGATARSSPLDARWLPVVTTHGYGDVQTYLRARHSIEHRTVAAIAAETGFSRAAVQAAMARHGIERVTHNGTRTQAAARDRRLARTLGFADLTSYILERRSSGHTWAAMAAESGLPETSLLRRRPTGLGHSGVIRG